MFERSSNRVFADASFIGDQQLLEDLERGYLYFSLAGRPLLTCEQINAALDRDGKVRYRYPAETGLRAGQEWILALAGW
jgi:hypothetical protein